MRMHTGTDQEAKGAKSAGPFAAVEARWPRPRGARWYRVDDDDRENEGDLRGRREGAPRRSLHGEFARLISA